MQTQATRLFRIAFSSAVLSLLCWGAARGQQQTAQDDKSSASSSGVHLIDTTDAAADNGAASAVRTASGAKSSEPATEGTTDATLRPVDQTKETLQPPPADLCADLPADPPASDAAPPAADNSPTEKEKPSAGDKPKAKLEPIPDPQQVGPTELEATSFHGVTPGVTTIEQMQKAWARAEGDPQARQDDDAVALDRALPSRRGQLHRRQGHVDHHPLRQGLPRQHRGQATRFDQGPAGVHRQRDGRDPRPGLSGARRAVFLRARATRPASRR